MFVGGAFLGGWGSRTVKNTLCQFCVNLVGTSWHLVTQLSTKNPCSPAGEIFVTYGCVTLHPAITNKINTAKIRFICLPPNGIILKI